VGAASLDDETADADSASSHPRKGVSTRMTISGTHGYRAPEVYARAYGKGVDWWDIGLLLLEMLTGSNPYRGHTRADSEYLAKHEQVETPAWFDAQTTSIVQAFLARDPARRLGCTEEGVGAILAHPFFESIDWDELIDIDARRDAAQSAHEVSGV
jgi:serine/threonine protein kinase